MTENKTRATEESVEKYLSAIEDESRRRDCEELVRLISRATQEPAKMWGTSIVGFGSYHYRYESGREGDSPLVGFASRKGDIALYLAPEFPERAGLLSKLGKHKVGKGCLYIRRLDDVDRETLEELIVDSLGERQRRHG